MNLVATPNRPNQHLHPVIRVQCAWCGRKLGSKRGGTAPAIVSHGICRPCGRKHFGPQAAPEPR